MKNLEEKLSEKRKELFANFEGEVRKVLECPSVDKPLCHYTTFSNFAKRIIKNTEFCFTDYRHLNDPTEVQLSVNTIKDVINKREAATSKAPFNSLLLEFFYRPLLEFLEAFVDPNEFARIKGRFGTVQNIESSIYTFSFCEEIDSLSLWRWYGDNGKGVCLVFKSTYFKIPATDVNHKEPLMIYTNVIYEKEIFAEGIDKILDMAEATFNQFFKFFQQNAIKRDESRQIEVQFLNELKASLASHLIPLMPAFKHYAYKDEKEHRLYYLESKITYRKELNNPPTFFPHEIPSERKGVRQRNPTEGICLPHIETKIPYVRSGKFSLDDVAEIWVGPCVHFECAQEQIVKLLIEAGYDSTKINTTNGIKIKKSEMPYR